jgi:DNA-binding transcriptional MerR regulator
MDASWTLSELVEEATAALERVPAPDNGQVRAVPDERSLRYYTSLGLLDRPAAMRGRTALYTARHLAQVVAIKRLQSAGKSLSEIQPLLASIDDATLSRLSGVALPKPTRTTRADFWKATAATPAVAAATTATATAAAPAAAAPAAAAAAVPAAAAAAAAAAALPATLRLSISLAPGIDLLIDADLAPPLDALDLTPILAELTRQGLRAQGPR